MKGVLEELGWDDDRAIISWREDINRQPSDWNLVVNGAGRDDGELSAKSYQVHLSVFGTQGLFYQIAQGSPPANEPSTFPSTTYAESQSRGEVLIRTRCGSSAYVGDSSMSVETFKSEITKLCGIGEYRQRLILSRGELRAEGGGEETSRELSEGWRTLEQYGVTRKSKLLLILREPWQKTDMACRTTYITCPILNFDTFEEFLDWLYTRFNQPTSVHNHPLRTGQPSELMTLLWLTSQFKMRDVGLLIYNKIQQTMNFQNACLFIVPAIVLNIKAIRNEAESRSRSNIDSIPDEVLRNLPLDSFERIMTSCTTAHGAKKSKSEIITSFIRMYKNSGNLDFFSWNRLSTLVLSLWPQYKGNKGRTVIEETKPMPAAKSPNAHLATAHRRARGGGGGGGALVDNEYPYHDENCNYAGDNSGKGALSDDVGVNRGKSAAISLNDTLFMLGIAVEFEDNMLRDFCLNQAARHFSDLKKDDLALLPVSTVVDLLNRDELAVDCEDDVVVTVREFLQGTESAGRQFITNEQQLSLWSCCRFPFCSLNAQAELLAATISSPLVKVFLAAVVTSAARGGGNSNKAEQIFSNKAEEMFSDLEVSVGLVQSRPRKHQSQVITLVLRCADRSMTMLLTVLSNVANLCRNDVAPGW